MAERRRALLVEDDPEARDALSQFLQVLGFDVMDAGDAEGALEIIARHHPEVIITDLTTPEIEPCGMVHRLRVRAGEEALIVVYSGRSDMEAAAQAAGADAFVLKPELEVLERLLKSPDVRGEARRTEGT